MNTCRFYKNEYPTVNDIVMVKVVDKNEYGYNVILLEYNNIPAFINLTELIKRRIKKKNVIKIDEVLPLYVIHVDENKKHINLSKNKLSLEDALQFSNNYKFRLNLNKLGLEIYNLHKLYDLSSTLTPEDIMENTIWRTIDNYYNDNNDNNDNNYNNQDVNYEKIYNYILRNLDILNTDILPIDFIEKVTENIKTRIIKKNMISETEIKLLVMSKEGVYAIKNLLDIKLEDKYINDFNVDIVTYGSSSYKIILYGTCDELAQEIVDNILMNIKNNSQKYKSIFSIVSNNKIIKESDMDIKFLSTYDLNKFTFN